MKPSDYQDIGQYLRDSRESLRVSITQAARDLHIRAKYLEALESGKLQDLPGKSYTRGYIRNYAQYLMLDVDMVLEAYVSLLGPKVSELFVPEPSAGHNIPAHWLLWGSLVGLFVLYGTWYFGFHDRTQVSQDVADVPAGFAHLLDKNAPPVMDKPWADCLNEGEPGCLVILRIQAAMTPLMMIYDTPTHNPPFQP